MACTKINDEYWVCDAVEGGFAAMGKGPENWTESWTQTIPEGTFKVWCRPGCDAKLAKYQPMGSPPWYEAGQIDDMPAGDYKLYCGPGDPGDKCSVKVEPVTSLS